MPRKFTSQEICDAFTLRSPYFRTEVTSYHTGSWHIVGRIVCRACEVQVASFTRRLELRGGNWIAVHDNMTVEKNFRRLGIAWAHYRICFTAYLEWGIGHVEMFANKFGPSVWPQFGFTFNDPDEQQKAVSWFQALVLEETGKTPVLQREDLEAYNLVFLQIGGAPPLVGNDESLAAIALKRTAESQESGALTYILNLTNPVAVRFLKEVGPLSDIEKAITQGEYDGPGIDGP